MGVDHEITGGGIVPVPQAHDLSLRPGVDQPPAQALDDFAGLNFRHSRFAGRHHHQLRPPQVACWTMVRQTLIVGTEGSGTERARALSGDWPRG